ncbi:sulfotransferase family protein [Xanthobacter sediminis]
MGGVLSQLGCDSPKTLMPPHESNPKGFFESVVICRLNDDILASAGSRWDDWQPFNAAWFDSPRASVFAERAGGVLDDEFGVSSLFVLKDPRICRFLPFWEGVFAAADIHPVVVHTHRNPLDVAQSLHSRDRMDPDFAQLLWLCHVLSAERDSRGMARSFISYDQLIENWARVADRISHDLGFGWPRLSTRTATEIAAFMSPALRHHARPVEQVVDNPLVSSWVREAYGILQRWSQDGERLEDHAELDRIAHEFRQSVPSFARLIDAGRSAAVKARKAEHQLVEVKSAVETQRDMIAHLDGRVGELAADVARLNAVLDARARELAELKMAGEAEALAAQEREHDLTARLDGAVQELAEKHKALTAISGELEATRASGEETARVLSARNDELRTSLDGRQKDLEIAREAFKEQSEKYAINITYESMAFFVADDERSLRKNFFSRKINRIKMKRSARRLVRCVSSGDRLLLEKDWEHAEKCYMDALNIDQSLFGAWLGLGHCCREVRRYSVAESAYRNAIVYAPNRSDTWFFWGVALRDLGRAPDARIAFMRCIDIDPEGEYSGHARRGIDELAIG